MFVLETIYRTTLRFFVFWILLLKIWNLLINYHHHHVLLSSNRNDNFVIVYHKTTHFWEVDFFLLWNYNGG